MPAIAPFRGLRFDSPGGRALARRLSPPYDVVSPEERDALAARSAHNLIHVDLPRPAAGQPEATRYEHAAATFASWVASGVLRREETRCVYPLEQRFTGPDGRLLVRRGVIVACRLYDFHDGVVVPHEQTLTGAKADRLELLRHVKANLSPVFGFYRDEGKPALAPLSAAFSQVPVFEVATDDGVLQRLWRVDDPEAVGALQAALADRQVFMADGHHRYETCLAWRDIVDRERPGLAADGGHRFILMFLCSMSDPGLVIYPIHRVITGIPGLRLAEVLAALERRFNVVTLPEDVSKPVGRAWAVARLSEHAGKASSFLMVSAEDRKARVITLRDDADLSDAPLPRSETIRALDVSILQGLVLQQALGLSAERLEDGSVLRYVKDAGEAVERTLAGEYQLAFLLNPTPMWQVEAVGDGGETMPPKSTFFSPRLWSGLVMRTVEPGEPP